MEQRIKDSITIIADRIDEDGDKTPQNVREALGAALSLLEIFMLNQQRIADSLEKLALPVTELGNGQHAVIHR